MFLLTMAEEYTVEALAKKEKEELDKEVRDTDKERLHRQMRNNLFSGQAAQLKFNSKVQEARLKENIKMKADEEEAVKKELAYKINQYLHRFPWLTDKLPKIGQKASVAEMEELLSLIRMEMNSQKSPERIKAWVDRLFLWGEHIWGDGSKMNFLPPALRFNLKGISKLELSGAFNEELIPLILEYDIEYPWLGRQNILLRTIESLGSIAYKVHLHNTNPMARKLMNLEKEAPMETSTKPEDL